MCINLMMVNNVVACVSQTPSPAYRNILLSYFGLKIFFLFGKSVLLPTHMFAARVTPWYF